MGILGQNPVLDFRKQVSTNRFLFDFVLESWESDRKSLCRRGRRALGEGLTLCNTLPMGFTMQNDTVMGLNIRNDTLMGLNLRNDTLMGLNMRNDTLMGLTMRNDTLMGLTMQNYIIMGLRVFTHYVNVFRVARSCPEWPAPGRIGQLLAGLASSWPGQSIRHDENDKISIRDIEIRIQREKWVQKMVVSSKFDSNPPKSHFQRSKIKFNYFCIFEIYIF